MIDAEQRLAWPRSVAAPIAAAAAELDLAIDEDADGSIAIVLLEPSTVELLVGALARHGEGPFPLYVAAPRAVASRAFAAAEAAGGRVIRAESGPLGPAALVRQPGPPGPFLLVVHVP